MAPVVSIREPGEMNCRVPLNSLSEERFAQVICYPKFDTDEFKKRLCEMSKLGIKALCFVGEKKVGEIPVLGKGHVGIVVLACTDSGYMALKIRRTDSDRETMKHEADMLQTANLVNVGPRLISYTQNFLLMNFIEGFLLPAWIEKIKKEKNVAGRVREVLSSLLEQCWRLDRAGLDHGELSRASKHIIVDHNDNPWILDFESASVARRVSNVTSICQFLFIKGETAKTINNVLREIDRDELIFLLRRYKSRPTRENFELLKNALLNA